MKLILQKNILKNFLSVVILLAFALPSSAQRLKSQTRPFLAARSYASPSVAGCKCPSNAVVINKNTAQATDIADEGIRSGEVYCLKNTTLIMDELSINGGKIIVMPDANLIIRGTLSVNAGFVQLQDGASLKTEVLHNMSGEIVLGKNASLHTLYFNDFNGEISFVENSRLEVDNLLRLTETKTFEYKGNTQLKASVAVYGDMTGNGIENFVSADANIRWDVMPKVKMAAK